MATTEFSLFRIKFIKPSQKSFLHDEERTPGDFFKICLEERPSFEYRERFVWHIGNLSYFSENSGYFAVGRTSKSTVDLYDENTKNFVEVEHKESPYSHCLFDSDIGILVIAKNSSLNQETTSIAKKIEELLTQNVEILKNEIRVEINPIPDPDGFLRQLGRAHLISRFTATFGGPNPFDADEFFQRPMSVYLAAAKGEEGSTTIRGESLDNETVTEVAKSTAATGNEASARIKRFKSSKPETIHLKGDPVKRRIDLAKVELRDVLEMFLKIYDNIRN
jgi:hypothetical protein